MEQLALGVIAPPTPRPSRHTSRIQAAEAPGNVLCIFQTNPGGLVVRKLKTVSHHF
ncbi:uncharacterized protein Dsimw501_GD26973, isoform B [Drosophila simulans]|uniref:Uncharacterized protein, isoform B n=1 Tax=Drosophila simulans TaxID=7240 RepID=A0A0J9TSZ3_DROSI|nr:uncharacterized protein Dsimw501_GD26973, isoform B [Drosophila simulans]